MKVDVSIEERFYRLEQENRRLWRQCRWTQVLAIAIGSVLLFMGASHTNTFENLTVQQLRIEDDKGAIRAQIGVDYRGGIVQTFLDAKGTQRIRIAVEQDGTARQRLFDDEGVVRVSSSTFPRHHKTAAGSAGQAIYDKNGLKRIRIGTDPDGSASQYFLDQEKQMRIWTGIDAEGNVKQLFSEKDGPMDVSK